MGGRCGWAVSCCTSLLERFEREPGVLNPSVPSASAIGVAGLGAILGYAGGKRTMAPLITRELGPHRCYIESFCGSLAVLLAKEPSSTEIANDLNGTVINLARVLASDRAAELYDRVARTIMHDDLFDEAAEAHGGNELDDERVAPSVVGVADIHVDAAYWSLIVHWQGRGGVAGTSSYNFAKSSRYTLTGGHAGSRWAAVADSIPAWHQRLRAVSFTRQDAIEQLERFEDADGVAHYLDPPYVVKSFRYVHDFEDEGVHRRLAQVCNTKRNARVVVSYYDHPLVRELYPSDRWTWVHVKATKSMTSPSGRDGRVEAPEVLLINGESYTQGPSLFGGAA